MSIFILIKSLFFDKLIFIACYESYRDRGTGLNDTAIKNLLIPWLEMPNAGLHIDKITSIMIL